MEITKRFHRIIAIYFQLQGRSIVKAQDLADRFDVSLRTIYRDMRSLEQAGIPIYGEAGTGYSLSEGYRLPPTSFTQEEIISLAAAEKLMQKFVDPDMFRHFSTAIGKIRSYLRYSDKTNMMLLEENMWMSSPGLTFNEKVPEALSVLFESISMRKTIVMEYRAVYRDQPNIRKIEPVGIYHEGNFWYFVAYCHLRDAYRQFRIDRIHKVSRTDETFTREHKPLSHYLDKKESHPSWTVRLRVELEFARYLQWDRSYYGFESEQIDGEYVVMTFQSNNPEQEFARWYLRFADHAQIVEPEALKTCVRRIIDHIKI
ncbi:helix-turn-helix transcriptional regulator [Sphingobacterium deserti]|uniref:Helix-turn-helix, type 11 domain-containing protein n=1 Tax=Sphingobacterium deserti TaxID=1229276 RepID=A0A0B8T2U9_9SPHI|nr:YafY family protein [Sphingobacterium deserti]KGE13238.1 helix-turn-helix, type 11 domain-containing protein [Sphingobacterium deserti]